jgi:hypothetical protein
LARPFQNKTIPEPGLTCNRRDAGRAFFPRVQRDRGGILFIMQFPKPNRTAALAAPREAAETLALQALAWIAAEPERLSGLMATTGLWPDEVSARATEPAFLGGVLDFLLGDEVQLLAFCTEMGVPPESPARLRAALPGGAADTP